MAWSVPYRLILALSSVPVCRLAVFMDLNSATIIVTGASGFIGSWVCEKLAEHLPEAHVVGVGRPRKDTRGQSAPRISSS